MTELDPPDLNRSPFAPSAGPSVPRPARILPSFGRGGAGGRCDPRKTPEESRAINQPTNYESNKHVIKWAIYGTVMESHLQSQPQVFRSFHARTHRPREKNALRVVDLVTSGH